MKNILVATDFTSAARCAEIYAAGLARALHCKLTLLSVYSQVPVTLSQSLTSVTTFDKDHYTHGRLDAEAALLDMGDAEHLVLMAREGSRVDTILAVAREVNADLIVTGMKFNGKRSRRIFGSTITGLLHRSAIPVLVIPEGFSYCTPKSVAMGNDFVHNRHALRNQVLHRLVELFEPKRYIYKHIAQGNVTEAINQFIEHYSIDMLVMEPENRHMLARWFLRSYTKDMLFKVSIPLMILPVPK